MWMEAISSKKLRARSQTPGRLSDPVGHWVPSVHFGTFGAQRVLGPLGPKRLLGPLSHPSLFGGVGRCYSLILDGGGMSFFDFGWIFGLFLIFGGWPKTTIVPVSVPPVPVSCPVPPAPVPKTSGFVRKLPARAEQEPNTPRTPRSPRGSPRGIPRNLAKFSGYRGSPTVSRDYAPAGSCSGWHRPRCFGG